MIVKYNFERKNQQRKREISFQKDDERENNGNV